MQSDQLFGIWKMMKVEIKPSDGDFEVQPFEMGQFSFATDSTLSLVHRSAGKFYAYLGHASVQDQQLFIDVKVSSDPNVEGTRLSRTIELLDDNQIALSFTTKKMQRTYRIQWKRISKIQK